MATLTLSQGVAHKDLKWNVIVYVKNNTPQYYAVVKKVECYWIKRNYFIDLIY